MSVMIGLQALRKENQIEAQRLRSRWRLCRLTDAACPLQAERVRFGEEEQRHERALTFEKKSEQAI